MCKFYDNGDTSIGIKWGNRFMVYGCSFNLFLKENSELTNKEKINKLKEYSVGDLLTLLRNIESSREYDEEIIKAVYECLYDKNIMCI